MRSDLFPAEPCERIRGKVHSVVADGDLKDTVVLFNGNEDPAVGDTRGFHGDDRILDMVTEQRLQIRLTDDVVDQIVRLFAHRQIKADTARGGFDIHLAQGAVDQRVPGGREYLVLLLLLGD